MDCYFCRNNINEINHKDTELLRRFITSLGKIRGKKRTGTCSRHQRKLTKVIKRARNMALLPYTTR